MREYDLPMFLKIEERVEYMTALDEAVAKDNEDKHRQQER